VAACDRIFYEYSKPTCKIEISFYQQNCVLDLIREDVQTCSCCFIFLFSVSLTVDYVFT
jgi:hypothetical protein